ncbi:esterase/lipase family protein [Nocardia sp. NPDC055029]
MSRLRHKIVYLPGIGGSALRTPDGSHRPWGGALGSSGTLLDPKRVNIDEHPHLIPDGLLVGTSMVRRLPNLPNYQGLLGRLEKRYATRAVIATPDGPVDPTAGVLVVPYDFRRSVAEAAVRLDEVVARWIPPVADEDDPMSRPVIVIGHSMGGLVASSWIGQLAGWRKAAALITLGTPHRGAPKALDWLVNDGRGPLARLAPEFRRWPGMYELLPRYRAVLDGTHQDPASLALYPHELQLDWLGASEAARFTSMAKDAFRVHEAIDRGWESIPAGRAPKVLVRYGSGHKTLASAVLHRDELVVTKEDPSWFDVPRPGGDSTVPGVSAVPWWMDGDHHLQRDVADRHGPIAVTSDIEGTLNPFAAPDGGHIRGDEPAARPRVGLDLEDQYLSDEAIRIGASLLSALATDGVAAWVQIRPVDGTAPPVVRRTALTSTTTGEWVGEFDPPAPGMYTVTVSVTGVPGTDEVICRDEIAVLDVAGEDA